MRFSSFIYLVGQGLHNLRANRLMTFASMGVLTVCMLLIGAASLLGINIDHMVEYIGNQNLTVVYMGGTGESEVATDEQIAAADAAIRSTPHVVSVTYMSPEDVLATYSDMLKDYTNLQQVFANDNPFTPNYRVTVDDPDNIKEVSAQLMQIDGVYSVKAPLAMADTFTSLQKVINYACYFSEIFRGGIQGIPSGQYEAGQVLGMTKSQIFFKVTLLQVIKRVIPPMGNEFINLVKDTALARTIAVYEVLWAGEKFVKNPGIIWPLFYTAVFYLLFSGILTLLFGWIEKKMDYFK